MVCVFPGLDDVKARFLRFTSALIKEDLPTFDLPIKANSGLTGMGPLEGSVLLTEKSAEWMIIAMGGKNTNKNEEIYPDSNLNYEKVEKGILCLDVANKWMGCRSKSEINRT